MKNLTRYDKSCTLWQEHCLWWKYVPCSGSAVAAGWVHLLQLASAWPGPHPSSRSTSTAPPGGPADETSAQHSPPDGLCQHEPSIWTVMILFVSPIKSLSTLDIQYNTTCEVHYWQVYLIDSSAALCLPLYNMSLQVYNNIIVDWYLFVNIFKARYSFFFIIKTYKNKNKITVTLCAETSYCHHS